MAQVAENLNEEKNPDEVDKALEKGTLFCKTFNTLGPNNVKRIIQEWLTRVLEKQENCKKRGPLDSCINVNVKNESERSDRIAENMRWIKRNIVYLRNKTYERIKRIFAIMSGNDCSVKITTQIGDTIKECLKFENKETKKEAYIRYKLFIERQWEVRQAAKQKGKKKPTKGKQQRICLTFQECLDPSKVSNLGSPYERWLKIEAIGGIDLQLCLGETVDLIHTTEKGHGRHVLHGITKDCCFMLDGEASGSNPAYYKRA